MAWENYKTYLFPAAHKLKPGKLCICTVYFKVVVHYGPYSFNNQL